jgi:helix-turn-helix protein
MVKHLEEIVLMAIMDKGEVSPFELSCETGIPVRLLCEVFERLINKGLLEEPEG